MRKKVSKDYISDVENFDKLPIYSKRIRNYLNENWITAKELNQKAGFASPSAVPELIKGTRDLSLDAAKKLCSVMNVSLDYLTGLTDVRTIDVKIRDICKYTGLSEKAIRIITGSEPVDVVNEYSKEDLKLLSDFLSDGALLLFLRDVDASRKSIEKAIRTSEKMLSNPDCYLSDGDGGYDYAYWHEKTCDDYKDFRLWRYEAIEAITDYVKSKLAHSEEKYQDLMAKIVALC